MRLEASNGSVKNPSKTSGKATGKKVETVPINGNADRPQMVPEIARFPSNRYRPSHQGHEPFRECFEI
jgi:hypothetical protein